MPDNPYRSASDVLATLPGPAALTAALREPDTVAPPGASADDAGISSEAALSDPVVNLVRRTGVALPDRSRAARRSMAALGVVAAVGMGAASYFTTHTMPFALAGIGVALAIIACVYFFPAPAMVIDSRGIWIVRRLRTDFCEWVAMRGSEVKELEAGKPEVTITLKGPEHAKHSRHTFSGRLRRPETNKIRLGDLEDPKKAPGHRHGAFEMFDKGGDAGLGMTPRFDPSTLSTILTNCIRAFGTPDDVVVPRRITEQIVIDPSEFDAPASDRRPASAMDNVANPGTSEND